MSLAPGDKLSYYEILGLLGAGGMGTVYRAMDSRLGREVAIKVLPVEFADDEERLRRFEREAKTLASLSHPNVAGIHGVDQVGDVCFLALELVSGEDLSERLSRGALPVDEALDVCRQIAEGLEAAHEAGVIHRDLKPANVRVTPDGIVKVLDFGLAKPVHPSANREGSSTAESDSFLMTEEGVVLGTPTYMSPEQARGKAVDRRTDLWAFGCVFYECLTGRRAFGGDSMTDVLAAIVGAEPNWELLPPLPPRVGELLRRSLAKNPRERLRDAGEARVQLELAKAEQSQIAPAGAFEGSTRGRGAFRPVLLMLGALALVAGYALRLATESGSAEPTNPAKQWAVVLAETEEEVSDLELSPDGSSVAWTQPSGVFIRRLESFDVIEVTLKDFDTAIEEPHRLAWSTDGSQLAFSTLTGLWRVDADGKHLTLVARDQLSPDSHAQLDWSRDGQLVYSDGASRNLFGRSFLVDQTTPLFSGDEETTLHFDGVHILPDESLLTVRHRVGIGTPDTLSLWRDAELRDILQLPGWNISGPAYSNGFLVFERKDTSPDSVWYVRMDLEAGRHIGDPQPLVDNGRHATLAGDSLAYVVSEASAGMRPVWIDLDGNVEPMPNVSAAEMRIPTISHDGERVFIFDVFSGGTVWAHVSHSGQRTSVGNLDQGTVVMGDLPDGRMLTFEVMGGIPTETLAVAHSGAAESICKGFLTSVSRDGQMGLALRYGEDGITAVAEIVDLVGGSDPIQLDLLPLTKSGMIFSSISPDNRWALVPTGNQGRAAIVLVGTQGDAPGTMVIADDCLSAWFSESGESIYYWAEADGSGSPFGNATELWRIEWNSEPEPKLGTPQKLFSLEDPVLVTGFDHDRGRFLASIRQTAGKCRILARTGWAANR